MQHNKSTMLSISPKLSLYTYFLPTCHTHIGMMMINSKDQIYNMCSVELIKLYNNLPSHLKNMHTTFQKEANTIFITTQLLYCEGIYVL